MKKILQYSSLFLPIGFVAYDYLTPQQIIQRNLRTIGCGIQILYNYKWRFSPQNVQQIHEDTARSIYQLCLNNDGLYVKFGQGIAASEHMLPPSYFKYFSKLQDQANSCSYEQVRKIFREQMNCEPEEVFAQFEKEPVAAASIAQVHVGILKDGRKVAVKVQKPNIQPQFKSDMFMHWLFCAMIEKCFDLPILAFADSIERNLEKEIDFRIQAENAEKCRSGFSQTQNRDIYVPQIYNQFTTQRILVMEWVDGIKITHKNELIQAGFNTQKVVQTAIEGFAEQIFLTGFTHCDPHPGNLFVREHPDYIQHNKGRQDQKHQVILLDYGLCFQINPKFRQQYCKFWKSMFLLKTDQMREIVKDWGVGDEQFFASAQLLKPFTKNKPIGVSITKDDIFNLQMKFQNDLKQMLGDTSQFPEDLIYIGRNMNLVRSINKQCGSAVNRVNLMARYAVQGIHQKQGTIQSSWSQFLFSTRLFFASFIYYFIQTWYKWKTGKGMEDLVQEQMKKAAQAQFEQYGMQAPDEKTYDA